MDPLVTWFRAQSPRDQRLAAVGAALLLSAAIFAIFVPLDSSVSRAHARVQHKVSDLAWMRSVAPQLAAAGAATPTPASQRSLIAVIDTSARESGLGSSLNSSEPSGPGLLRVRLDKAPFDTLVVWLARLARQNGIHVESATIDAAGAPGLVNAGIVLRTASTD
ncbi:MAG TPA: type II secretion system protein GspM [Steroidobacteraceae bacterium]|jgi:general secretion pathway protein M